MRSIGCTVKVLAICLALPSEIQVRAGYPSDKFDDLNAHNIKQRKLSPVAMGHGPIAGAGEGTVIVNCVNTEGCDAAAAAAERSGAHTEAALPKLNMLIMNVPDENMKEAMQSLNSLSSVIDVELDVEVTAMPVFDSPPSSLRPGSRRLVEDTPWGITTVKAQQVGGSGETNIKVCVVDTGYGNGHPDLPRKVEHGVDGFSPYPGQELWDVDGHGHGSHCAGTIGAIGENNVGVVGVNPDPNKFSFFIGKGLKNSGSGSNAGVLEAVEMCIENGAKIISMSLGGGGFSQAGHDAYQDAYENEDVLIIAAAGNGGNSALGYPASYPHVMSVAAVDSGLNKAGFSQYNSQVEIAAPGVLVESTITNNSGAGFTYASWSGTSMACPHVAGVAALVWSHFPSCSNHQIRHALLKSTNTQGDPCNVNFGYGIVDAQAAFNLLTAGGCEAGSDDAEKTSPGGCNQLPVDLGPTPSPTPFPPTPSPTPFSCPPDQRSVHFEITTDNYGGETSWTIASQSGVVVREGGNYARNTDYNDLFCTANDECLDFTIIDSYGDGICCGYGIGSYTISTGDEVVTGGEFTHTETKQFGCPEDIVGCEASCQTEGAPWVAGNMDDAKCSNSDCENCDQCKICTRGCDWSYGPATYCQLEQCSGCEECE